MGDNVISFRAKKDGSSKHLGTFHVYENSENDFEVVIEGDGNEPSNDQIIGWLRCALWAQIDDPIAVAIINEKFAIIDADSSARNTLESWDILKDTILNAHAKKQAENAHS